MLAATLTALASSMALLAAAGPAAASHAGGPDGLLSCRARGAACARPDAPVAALPEPNGTMSNAEFVAAAAPGAQRSQREYGVPSSVTIAQAILESGWGRSALASVDRNFFGMKCFGVGSFAVGCSEHSTSECTAAGQCFPATASFRTYASAADSFRDHGATLAGNARYAAAFAYRGAPDLFIAEVAKAGYATDPQYTAKVTAIMTKFNLYQYDLAAR
ncbi:sporangiospore maturation cell wall hydrolase GsmA [Dactylosporangium sp. NPDC051485]|uniref:sporangiospore maturation cell wall hydrolase GsmA n=1 Tax=Dactylosporangium sp. NPDC051485 TaxID=3154846 RepID=UPI003436CD11